jgi:hypothetical protein
MERGKVDLLLEPIQACPSLAAAQAFTSIAGERQHVGIDPVRGSILSSALVKKHLRVLYFLPEEQTS